MKHTFIENKSVDIEQYEDIDKVEVCKFCDVERWTHIVICDSKLLKQQYMLNKGTQYWDPEEECSDPYKLQKLSGNQLKLF